MSGGAAKPPLIALNARGCRINENHPGAKLTDAEVAVLLDLRDEGYSYAWLAEKFCVSKSCARWICTGRNRNQTADHHAPARLGRPPSTPTKSTRAKADEPVLNSAALDLQQALAAWR